MARSNNKRGKNPVVVDSWLDNLGLYRKNVAYDETCLFRAVSEQLFDCQVYHERVRKECIIYARQNFNEFAHLVRSFEMLEEHLNLLEKHMVVCGDLEINIISRKYRHDIIIYDAARTEVFQATNNGYSSFLRLCLMDDDHYDVVYKKEHIVTAGFCQSIVYKILYEDVFNIPKVDDIVRTMLYEKTNIITQSPELLAEKKMSSDMNNNDSELLPLQEEKEGVPLPSITNNIAPFPFKVAKALDPSIYRNIEYDSWGEVRRELRLGEWYYGDDKLILGTRCILNDINSHETYDCYIQEIIKDQNKCVVYLTKLAQKRTVNYTDLSPENDAKPWPLPYRFSKNLVIASPLVAAPEKTPRASKKRNKEKRRTKSCSESSAPGPSETVENVSAYVGVPLQMHNPNETTYHEQDVPSETQVEPLPPEQMMTPDIQSSPSRYQWDPPPWHQLLPPTPDPMVWPQTPTGPHQNMFNFNVKPMVASAPVTPDVVPYHDSNFPFYYNYQVDPYPQYNHWQPQPVEAHSPLQKPDTEKSFEDPNKNHVSENEMSFAHFTENEPTPMVTSPSGRPTLCTNLTPQPTPMEMYSPIIPMAGIHTPMVYIPPPQEMADLMVTSPPIMYTPPVDMQYISPTPFVYPPTPPAAWYPTGVNSHGFIFPQRHQ